MLLVEGSVSQEWGRQMKFQGPGKISKVDQGGDLPLSNQREQRQTQYDMCLGIMDTLVWPEWQFALRSLDMSWKSRWGSYWKVHSVKANGILSEAGHHPVSKQCGDGKKAMFLQALSSGDAHLLLWKGGSESRKTRLRFCTNSAILWPHQSCLERRDRTGKSQPSVYACSADSLQPLSPPLSNRQDQSPCPHWNGQSKSKSAQGSARKMPSAF